MTTLNKNIAITPNIGSASADPKIVFSGADISTAAQNISMTIYPTNNGTLSFDGIAGQLFSISNNVTGTLFAINDISGMPSIEVLDSGAVKLAQYGGNVGIGVAAPAAKLHALATTEQLRLGYDTSNYWTDTIATTGARTLAGVGVGGGLTITPTSGQNINFSLATTGDFVVNSTHLCVDTSAASVGIGVAAPAAKLHALATTEQLRLGYDISNYWTDTIATTGARTLAGVGVGGSLTITPTSGKSVIINAPINQSAKTVEYSGTKVLTDGVITNLFEIAIVGNSAGVGAFMSYSVLATNGTAVQMHSGFANIVGCSGSTGTITSAIAEAATEAECWTADTVKLTESGWAVTNGTGKITVTANFDSSLSAPTITMTYKLIVFGTNAVVLL